MTSQKRKLRMDGDLQFVSALPRAGDVGKSLQAVVVSW